MKEIPELFRKLTPEEEKRNLIEWLVLSKEVLKHFKCYRCGECCSKAPVLLLKNELNSILDKLGITETEFIEKYVGKIVNSKLLYLKNPCPFLERDDNGKAVCKIYDFRPLECQLYPLGGTNTLYNTTSCKMAKDIFDEIMKLRLNLYEPTEEQKKMFLDKKDDQKKFISSILPGSASKEKATDIFITTGILVKLLDKFEGEKNE